MRFYTWNVRSLYRTVTLTEAAEELARYKLELVGVYEVRWGKGGTVAARDYNFSMERKRKSLIGNRIFYKPPNTISVKRVDLLTIGCSSESSVA